MKNLSFENSMDYAILFSNYFVHGKSFYNRLKTRDEMYRLFWNLYQMVTKPGCDYNEFCRLLGTTNLAYNTTTEFLKELKRLREKTIAPEKVYNSETWLSMLDKLIDDIQNNNVEFMNVDPATAFRKSTINLPGYQWEHLEQEAVRITYERKEKTSAAQALREIIDREINFRDPFKRGEIAREIGLTPEQLGVWNLILNKLDNPSK
jgi:hypothetical protein